MSGQEILYDLNYVGILILALSLDQNNEFSQIHAFRLKDSIGQQK